MCKNVVLSRMSQRDYEDTYTDTIRTAKMSAGRQPLDIHVLQSSPENEEAVQYKGQNMRQCAVDTGDHWEINRHSEVTDRVVNMTYLKSAVQPPSRIKPSSSSHLIKQTIPTPAFGLPTRKFGGKSGNGQQKRFYFDRETHLRHSSSRHLPRSLSRSGSAPRTVTPAPSFATADGV